MSDLVDRARRYATEAHTRINHLRKYTRQPYAVHLKAVAQLVQEVSDDPEMIAAAWLHDTVEDTEVTFQDLELEFGPAVAQLVSELTDVSRLADGNRAVRKAIDRAHLAGASPRGQTIKLADLIDNCRDIARHDEGFARTYAVEKAALLEVLTRGDRRLLERAHRVLQQTLARLDIDLPTAAPPADPDQPDAADPLPRDNLQSVFTRAFAARDVAEALPSFDAASPAEAVAEQMAERGLLVAGVRHGGAVRGYVLPYDLVDGACGAAERAFRADQVLRAGASLSAVIEVLTRHDHVFVELLPGAVGGVITRADIQKPVVRMWLFGMITLVEMTLVERIARRFPDETWRERVAPARLARAEALCAERERRDQGGSLLECLQFADKAEILLSVDAELRAFGFPSRKEAKRVIKQLESLRNNLAHAQDIVTHDWPQIARMTRNLELRARRELEGR